MKNISIIIIFFAVAALGGGIINLALAATPRPSVKATVTPTGSVKSQQIENLKDRLATKVAELKNKERRAVLGTVKSISLTTIVIETLTKDLKLERTDEIVVYKFSKGSSAKSTLESLTKGDQVVVFGYYDGTLDLLEGRIIVIQPTSARIIGGKISAVDRKEFTLTVKTFTGEEVTVDIETNTKTNQVNSTGEVEKAGFSQLQIGDRVQIVGTLNAKEDNRISASRILAILTQATPTPTVEVSPTLKATTKPTAKPTQ